MADIEVDEEEEENEEKDDAEDVLVLVRGAEER